MLDINEYAKAKGIPVDSIPADIFKKAQEKSFAIRKARDPMADTFKQMCTKSQELLKACAAESGVRGVNYGFYLSAVVVFNIEDIWNLICISDDEVLVHHFCSAFLWRRIQTALHSLLPALTKR